MPQCADSSGHPMPKVSVIINCLNGERYLREAIDSVYAQTFTDWEIVLWDNASTDATAAIASGYDRRLRYFRSDSTAPLGAARRWALAEAQGEWIAFLDCDDYWFPRKLAQQLAALDAGDYVMCYAGIVEIAPEGKRIRQVLPANQSGMMIDRLLRQFEINMVTPLVRHRALDEFGLTFDDNVAASEEYNLFMRLAAKGSICVLPEVLGAWRISPGSLTDRQISRWGEERHHTLDRLEAENPGIRERFPAAFREARARGDYYRARYQAKVGHMSLARQLMASIKSVDLRYRFLWLSLYVPGMWSLIHCNAVKRKWAPLAFSVLRVFRSQA